MTGPGTATARAHPNIALVKYWGKRDVALNLPAAGSLSITLDQLATITEVAFDPSLAADELVLNDRPDTARLARVSACLDRLRALAGETRRARVRSHNNFPTAAGLASSASGFAALVVAATRALGLDLDDAAQSVQARLGSGSAARSLFGGFVEMHPGTRDDGADAFATPLHDAGHWPLRVVIAITSRQTKAHSSTDGMERSRQTSPYYPAWVAGTARDLEDARAAIAARDFEALAAVGEHSCLKMHAVMLASRPGLAYFNGATMEGIHRVRELRAGGTAAFFTIDAGPQLKVVTTAEDAPRVAGELESLPGVREVITTGLGGPALVLDSPA